MKYFLLSISLTISLLMLDCGKKRTTPRPIPTIEPTPKPSPTISPVPSPEVSPTVLPSPTLSPTPIPIVKATPYPTPIVDINKWLHPIPTGNVATIDGTKVEDLSIAVQAAQNDPNVSMVQLINGGSFKAPVIFNKYTKFDSSTYSCDVTDARSLKGFPQVSDYGCLLVKDGVTMEGTWKVPQKLIELFKKGNPANWKDPYLVAVQSMTKEEWAGEGTKILEPTYFRNFPGIEVFQSFDDVCCSHTDKAEGVVIRGFHIVGRQTKYDGGVRSTILLGNCHNCAVFDTYLEDTAGIGVTAGGSGQEFRKPDGTILKNNFANNVLMTRNVASGVAAANIATINSENVFVFENYAFRLGHHNPIFGGGVCAIDNETNSPADHSGGWIFNNIADYEGSHIGGAGNAFCIQDPYVSVNGKQLIVVNNYAIGGRNDNIHRYMSNGIFLNGLKNCIVKNNYVYRTGQNAIQAYNLDGCTIEDNDLEMTGGGGNPTIWMTGVRNSTIRRNFWRRREGVQINVQRGILDKCGSNNIIENNGEGQDPATRISCPTPTPNPANRR